MSDPDDETTPPGPGAKDQPAEGGREEADRGAPTTGEQQQSGGAGDDA